MVAKLVNAGLILATRDRRTSALDELVAVCGWPAVLQATPRRIWRQMSLGIPEVALIWLDDRRELAASVRLLEWLKASHPAIRRLAVTHRLAPDHIEPAIRSAGVHFFLALEGQLHTLAKDLRWHVDRALLPPP